MDAQTFLSHLRGALDVGWKEANTWPQKPSEYSNYIFPVLAKAASSARMAYRGRGHDYELLYDGVWLPQNDGKYRLPQVIIEHENGVTEKDFIYDMRKLVMGWAPLRVMIGYVPIGHEPHERLAQINAAAVAGRWAYPDGCTDLALVGPYRMETPRSYLVLHRPAGAGAFATWGELDEVANVPDR